LPSIQRPRAIPNFAPHKIELRTEDIEMTQVLNPHDTGEIARPIDAQTIRLAIGEQTEKIYVTNPPPLRSLDETERLEVADVRMTGETLILDTRPAEAFDPGSYPPVPKPTPPAPGKSLADELLTGPDQPAPQPLPNPGPPPRPSWAGHESAEHPLVRRSVPYVMPAGHHRRGVLYRGRHAERPYRWLIGVGALMAASAVLTLIVLAVFR
jgi:hypothetical protein